MNLQHPPPNIQHPTSNSASERSGTLGVGCSKLDVRCFTCQGFMVPMRFKKMEAAHDPEAMHRRQFLATWRLLLTLFVAFTLAPSFVRGADEAPTKTLFLPKSPTAAAYILGRLSNKELIEAPRSEFVYIALLHHK